MPGLTMFDISVHKEGSRSLLQKMLLQQTLFRFLYSDESLAFPAGTTRRHYGVTVQPIPLRQTDASLHGALRNDSTPPRHSTTSRLHSP